MVNLAKFHMSPAHTSPPFQLSLPRRGENAEKSNAPAAPPLAYSRKEAAEMLGISMPALDRLAKKGKIRPSHLGGRVLYQTSDLVALLENNKASSKRD